MTISTRAVSLIGAAALILAGSACAQKSTETEQTSTEIDPTVFRIYLESRIQQPASQATQEQTEAIRKELTDLYLLSATPRAAELKEGQEMKARIELQTRAMLAQAVAQDFITNNPATEEETFSSKPRARPPTSSPSWKTVLISRSSPRKNRPARRAHPGATSAGSHLSGWSLNFPRPCRPSGTAPTRRRLCRRSLAGT